MQAGGNLQGVGRQKSDNPIDTKKEIAKIAGVSHDTVNKYERIKSVMIG
jgi:transcriptional regulator with XRE-family HTH domain